MKIINCDRFMFRPKNANVYCSKPAGHEGQHVFTVPELAEGQRPMVERKPNTTEKQQGIVHSK